MNGMMNNFLVAAPGSERVDGHVRSEQILDLSDEGSAQLLMEVDLCCTSSGSHHKAPAVY